MIKILKWLGIIIGSIIAIFLIIGLIANESKPIGETGEKADDLARMMLQAIDKPAWDSTRYVRWTFKGMHEFMWDKERNLVKVNWDDNEALVDLDEITGQAFVNGNQLSDVENDEKVRKAWEYFCNDSFWLNAPAKAFDPGTERSIIKMDDGSEALMVSYMSGGVTPGDSYLWILDEKGMPKSWKMWVKIIPVGGIGWTWEDWTKLPSGAKISTLHQNPLLNIDITNLMGSQDLQKLGYNSDPFAAIVN
ncbi:MAG: hypothetical protein AB8G22_28190 [Saprospiraceae bacterium]